MPRLRLATPTDPILRSINHEIAFPLDSQTRELIDQMAFACKKFKGIGLAAPQIGRSLKLAIINLAEYHLPLFPILNPMIVSASHRKNAIEEGCLSLPGQFGLVRRPEKITVRFFNPAGKEGKLTVDGLLAKVFQHEIDHLNGVLISDKWDPSTVHTYTAEEVKQHRKERKKRYPSQGPV